MSYIEKREENECWQDHRIVFKAVALALGIANFHLGFFKKGADNKNHFTLVGVGLAPLAIASFM